MIRQPVYVTGIGFAGAAGSGAAALAERLRAGRSAVRRLGREEQPIPLLKIGALLEAGWDWRETEGARGLSPRALERAEKYLRGADVSLRADAAALLEAKGAADIAPGRLGLVVGGSNLAGWALAEEASRFRRNPAHVNPRIGFQGLDTHVAATLAALADAQGPVMNVAAAAASGAVAAVAALDLIRGGRCDACLAVGAMQRLTPVDWQALAALGALNTSADPAPPFSAGGGGFTPGEGAACVLLERADHATRRGAAGLAVLAGGAFVSAADPLPHPSRSHAARAMALALADAGIEPGQVDLVTAHATGTAQGDAAEAGAVADVMESSQRRVWVAAPKAVTGHCLGAAGLVGLVATVSMLQDGRVYPVPAMPPSLSALLRFAAEGAIDIPLCCAINNAFGFGGFNAALAIRNLPG